MNQIRINKFMCIPENDKIQKKNILRKLDNPPNLINNRRNFSLSSDDIEKIENIDILELHSMSIESFFIDGL